MPDLFTHLAAAHIARRTVEIKRAVPSSQHSYTMFYLGTILPDIISRPPTILFQEQSVYWFVEQTHTPFALLFMSYLIVMFIKEKSRIKYFVILLYGIGLHCLLDLMQKHLASGTYYWFFPFSWETFNIPLFWPSDSILAIPFLLIVIGIYEAFCFYKRGVRKFDRMNNS